MTSRERVRRTVCHQQTDRLAKDFLPSTLTMQRLKIALGVAEEEAVFSHMGADIRTMDATAWYKKTLRQWRDEGGTLWQETFWGYERKHFFAGQDWNLVTTRYALDPELELPDALERYTFPDPEAFDYSQAERYCEIHPDKAIMVGHAGAYQMAATNLRGPEQLFIDMIEEPEACQELFDRMNDFLIEHYRRILEAAKGRVDILLIHDDYGTQNSLLFSVPMWKQYFSRNLRRFADLAHSHGAFLMQHSCGAVEPLISEMIACGVDMLDPVQKVAGMEPEILREKYGGKITFHGGIDTQQLLPNGSVQQVREECDRFIQTLSHNGGYVFSSSQHLQADIPVENILAMYDQAGKY